ncbi:GNAT family N-acetyltransferase [Effusibacillus dendaii]|uniref:N-acetyltransferase n=1 Tax=Effusibacillus dendaii TaxID=2743772 RepID=A0A7I8D861_9BACL|nr:GNAT family N-acetyltransferase [Effusibacillus dendaii]BCJ86343.1 N-acetyltransferase [Effusibacillus dendaii]
MYTVSTDRDRLDLDRVYSFLHKEAYWSQGIPREIVIRSVQNSLCFGVYLGEEQVGFARVISDFATYAYLADVFITEPHRGRGLSKLLLESILSHPDLQGIRRFMLMTQDAQGLYEKFGFQTVAVPDMHMERVVPIDQLYGSD